MVDSLVYPLVPGGTVVVPARSGVSRYTIRIFRDTNGGFAGPARVRNSLSQALSREWTAADFPDPGDEVAAGDFLADGIDVFLSAGLRGTVAVTP